MSRSILISKLQISNALLSIMCKIVCTVTSPFPSYLTRVFILTSRPWTLRVLIHTDCWSTDRKSVYAVKILLVLYAIHVFTVHGCNLAEDVRCELDVAPRPRCFGFHRDDRLPFNHSHAVRWMWSSKLRPTEGSRQSRARIANISETQTRTSDTLVKMTLVRRKCVIHETNNINGPILCWSMIKVSEHKRPSARSVVELHNSHAWRVREDVQSTKQRLLLRRELKVLLNRDSVGSNVMAEKSISG